MQRMHTMDRRHSGILMATDPMNHHIVLIGTPTKQQASIQECLEVFGYCARQWPCLSAQTPSTANHSSRPPDLLIFHVTDPAQLLDELSDPPTWLHQTPKLVIGLSGNELTPAITAALGPAGFIKNGINGSELAHIIKQVLPDL